MITSCRPIGKVGKESVILQLQNRNHMPNDTTTRRPFGDMAKRNLMTPEQVFASQGRIPPQATDLEEVVLGALMLEKDAVNEVIDLLSPDAFYLDKHQKIFAAIKDLFGKSEPIDILMVTNELKQRGELEMVGGAYYISKLTNRVVSAANIEYHALFSKGLTEMYVCG